MIKKYFALSLITASMIVAGCSSDDDDPMDPVDPMEPVDPVVTATPGEGGTAFDTVALSPDHTTLLAAINAAGLADTLDNPANTFTIFAPTNAAFEALDNDGDDATPTTADLLNDIPALSRILQYHVLAGDISDTAVSTLITDAGDGDATAPTILMDGETAQVLTFTSSDSASTGVAVNGIDVDAVNVGADAEGAVGRVHVIGGLLIPAAAPEPMEPMEPAENPDPNPAAPTGAADTILADAGGFEIFRAAVNRDFSGALDTNAWTVFVPSDATLSGSSVSDLTVAQQQDHIVSAGANDPVTLAGLATITASSGVEYPVVTTDGVTTVNGSVVTFLGTGAAGAQIYSIDGILAAP